MPLIPFAKASDVQTLTPCDDAVAELAVRLASAGIRQAVGWDVDRVVNATYTRLYQPRYGVALGGGDPLLTRSPYPSRRHRPSIVLPVMNLTNVASVVVDGRTLGADEWDATSSGIVYLDAYPQKTATVTYTAGYVRRPEDTAPGIFEQVCIEQALLLAANPENLRSWAQGGASETFADRAPLVDDDRLTPYKVGAL